MIKKIAMFFGLLLLIAAAGSYLFVTNYGERGSGISQTDIRELDSFNEISFQELGTLNVFFGETQSVSVTTDDNLVGLVETRVEDGRLRIRPVKPLNPKIDLVIDVTIPELTRLEGAGAVSLKIHDINAESLEIEVAGACGIDATGKVEDLSVELAGACRARLKSLQAKHAKVEIAGTGSAVVFASESIDAEASGFASITCYGNPPDVKKEANGLCRVSIKGQ